MFLEGVKVETIILIFKKDKSKISDNNCKVIIYPQNDNITHVGEDNALSYSLYKQTEWKKEGTINISSNKEVKRVLKKIEDGSKPHEFYCDFSLGLTPYDKYKGHSKDDIENKTFHSSKQITKHHKPLFKR